jgi:hypothetical protein
VFLGRTNWGPLANEPAAIGLCEASWVSVNLEGMGMDEHYWRNLTLFCLNTRMFFLWAHESSETAGFLKQPPSGGLDQQFWPTSRFNTNWAQLSLWNAQPTTGNLTTSVWENQPEISWETPVLNNWNIKRCGQVNVVLWNIQVY